MTHPLSVLQNARAEHVEAEPFPHLVVRDALQRDLYRELSASFPNPAALGIDNRPNNLRWDVAAPDATAHAALSPLWRQFIAYQASPAFFRELTALFHPHISALYGERFPDRASIETLRPGLRGVDGYGDKDVLIDALVSGNTPVRAASSVRGSHVDRGNKLYSGMFYMRPEGYEAVGGDLTLSRFKPRYATLAQKLAQFRRAYVSDAALECVKTIRYDANVVVLFINSLEAVHGVTPRLPTPHSRLFVNLVGEVDPPLYRLQGKHGPASYAPFADEPGSWLQRLRQRLAA